MSGLKKLDRSLADHSRNMEGQYELVRVSSKRLDRGCLERTIHNEKFIVLRSEGQGYVPVVGSGGGDGVSSRDVGEPGEIRVALAMTTAASGI